MNKKNINWKGAETQVYCFPVFCAFFVDPINGKPTALIL